MASEPVKQQTPWRLYLYYHYFDTGLLDEAYQAIEEEYAFAVEGEQELTVLTAPVLVEYAFATAWLKSQALRMREILDQPEVQQLVDQIPLFRAAAAIELAEGHLDAALSAVANGRNLIHERYPEMPDNIVAEYEWLDAIEENCRIMMADAAPAAVEPEPPEEPSGDA
jgi:hypothetical protein